MPLPLLAAAMLPAAISGAAGIAGQGISAITQAITNKKNYKRAQSMRDYDNAYNHPKEQMKRLKEAGLNPAMMYGGSQSVQASSGTAPQAQAPQFDLGGIVGNMMQAMQMQAQTANLKEVNENLKLQGQATKLENVLRDAKIFEYDRKNKMQQSFLDTTLEGLKYKNQLTQADIAYRLDENERRTMLTAQSLTKGVGEILQQDLQRAKTAAETKQIKAQIGILNSDQQIKDWEVQLSKDGINKTDPIYLKWASKIKDYVKAKAKQVIIDNEMPSFKQDFKNYLNK